MLSTLLLASAVAVAGVGAIEGIANTRSGPELYQPRHASFNAVGGRTAAAPARPRLHPRGRATADASTAAPLPPAPQALAAGSGFVGDNLVQQAAAFSGQDVSPPDNGTAANGA